jgi:hypothetical protein
VTLLPPPTPGGLDIVPSRHVSSSVLATNTRQPTVSLVYKTWPTLPLRALGKALAPW